LILGALPNSVKIPVNCYDLNYSTKLPKQQQQYIERTAAGPCVGTKGSSSIWRNLEMSNSGRLCHGQYDCLQASSSHIHLGFLFKMFGKLSNAVWHFKIKGIMSTLELAFFKAIKAVGMHEKAASMLAKKKKELAYDEVLYLKPGELVEVKSEQEIRATLNLNRRYKGLYFMRGMRKFCGQRLRVYKRVEQILLESSGEFRKVKNTVLLEGAICDGQERCRCDRSCFYYWRELWLRKVEQ